MTTPELTEEKIAAAMAKADRRVCVGSDRCFALPHLLADARKTCTPKGRCKVGWIVARGGRESFDVDPAHDAPAIATARAHSPRRWPHRDCPRWARTAGGRRPPSVPEGDEGMHA